MWTIIHRGSEVRAFPADLWAALADDASFHGWAVVEAPADYDPDGPSHIVAGGAVVPNTPLALRRLRDERNRRLIDCDWTQLPDAPDAAREAWAVYRQSLRDLPATTIDPFNPQWPEPPGATQGEN